METVKLDCLKGMRIKAAAFSERGGWQFKGGRLDFPRREGTSVMGTLGMRKTRAGWDTASQWWQRFQMRTAKH